MAGMDPGYTYATEIGMHKLLVIGALGFVLNSHATVTVGSCPEAFEGKVKAIANEMGAQEGFATQKVIFNNQQNLRGELPNQVIVNMLVNGPFEVEAGKDYRVQLRKGRLCWIEAI